MLARFPSSSLELVADGTLLFCVLLARGLMDAEVLSLASNWDFTQSAGKFATCSCGKDATGRVSCCPSAAIAKAAVFICAVIRLLIRALWIFPLHPSLGQTRLGRATEKSIVMDKWRWWMWSWCPEPFPRVFAHQLQLLCFHWPQPTLPGERELLLHRNFRVKEYLLVHCV